VLISPSLLFSNTSSNVLMKLESGIFFPSWCELTVQGVGSNLQQPEHFRQLQSLLKGLPQSQLALTAIWKPRLDTCGELATGRTVFPTIMGRGSESHKLSSLLSGWHSMRGVISRNCCFARQVLASLKDAHRRQHVQIFVVSSCSLQLHQPIFTPLINFSLILSPASYCKQLRPLPVLMKSASSQRPERSHTSL